jgi:magnesium chelatase family protein
MVARIHTVAFQGIEVLPIEVQVQMAPGLPSFVVVGLPDKAVAESRERVRAALNAIGLALPPKRIVVNLAPADVQKEGRASTCRSRPACWSPWACCPATSSKPM